MRQATTTPSMIKSYSTNVPPAWRKAAAAWIVALHAEIVHHGFTVKCQSPFKSAQRKGPTDATFLKRITISEQLQRRRHIIYIR